MIFIWYGIFDDPDARLGGDFLFLAREHTCFSQPLQIKQKQIHTVEVAKQLWQIKF